PTKHRRNAPRRVDFRGIASQASAERRDRRARPVCRPPQHDRLSLHLLHRTGRVPPARTRPRSARAPAGPEDLMSRKRRRLARRKPLWLALEHLEARDAPAANILASVNSLTYPQQQFKEFTPTGSLVRTLNIPPGSTQEDARDLVGGDDGRIHIYNGTFSPYLTTLDTANNWSHRTYAGWSTVNGTMYAA